MAPSEIFSNYQNILAIFYLSSSLSNKSVIHGISIKLGKIYVGIDGTWIIEASKQTCFYSRLISHNTIIPHILSFYNKDNVSLFSYTLKCLNWHGIASGKFSIFLIHKFSIILTPGYDDCRSTPPDSHAHSKYFFQFFEWGKYHLILPLEIWLKH
jgi:hypothetical protein